MTDPVITADGHTYERANIEGWLRNSSMSPMTGAPLANKNLIPNIGLRQTIEEWREQQDARRKDDRKVFQVTDPSK